MRTLLIVGIPALLGLSACNSDCGPPTTYNTYLYRVFANPVSSESTNPVFTQGPDFWSYGSPANGVSEWQFQWGGAAVGPVTVLIDGQSFEGSGELDELECGSALVNFNGVYVDDDTDVDHTFNASLSLQLWTEESGEGKLGAFLIWKESWTHPSSESGSFSAESHLTGDLVGQDS